MPDLVLGDFLGVLWCQNTKKCGTLLRLQIGRPSVETESTHLWQEESSGPEWQFRQLLDKLPAGAYTCDAKGLITYYNQQAVETWGRAPALNDPVDRFCGSFKLYWTDGTPIRHDQCWMARALFDQREYNGEEIVVERPDGERRTVLAHANPIRDESGTLLGAVNVLVDITGRKQAETAQAFLAAIVESSVDAIVSKNLDGTILSWNRGAERLFGWTSEEAVGRHITLIIPPERLDEEHMILDRLRRGERIEHYQTVRVAKDGRRIDISVTISPVRDAQGRVIAASKVARDISAAKRAEEALRASQQRFRLVAETVPSIVWSADSDGTITYANEQWYEYTGLTPEENARDWLNLVVHPDDRERCGDNWRRALREGTEFRIEVRNRRRDGVYRWFVTRAVPLHDESGRIVQWFGATTDIDEIREADRRKDEFLAVLAHELRNPLAPITNSLHLLRLSDDLTPAVARIRDVMEQQVNHMIRLIDDLLDVSRISRGRIELRLQRVDLAAVVDAAVETSRPLLESAKHQFAISLPATPLTVEADSVRLAQVISNLLNNAIKYTEEGGQIHLTARREGDAAVVSVRDNGVGISREMLARVFDMFTQIDRTINRSQGGLGIGLTLVKNLVEMHGGTIEVQSEGVGCGSEFTVRLPLVVGQARPLPSFPAPPTEGLSPVKSRRILVVDDTRVSAVMLGMLLEKMGHRVLTAYDGVSALDMALAERPEIVISDISMPKVDGYELARRLRGEPLLEGVVLVALTGYGQEADRNLALEAGFDHHLVKPVAVDSLEELLAVIPTPLQMST